MSGRAVLEHLAAQIGRVGANQLRCERRGGPLATQGNRRSVLSQGADAAVFFLVATEPPRLPNLPSDPRPTSRSRTLAYHTGGP